MIMRFAISSRIFRSTFACFQTKKIYRAPTRCMATSIDHSFSIVNVNTLLHSSFLNVLLVTNEDSQEDESCMVERRNIDEQTCKPMNNSHTHLRRNRFRRPRFNSSLLALASNDEIRIPPIVHPLKPSFVTRHPGDG